MNVPDRTGPSPLTCITDGTNYAENAVGFYYPYHMAPEITYSAEQEIVVGTVFEWVVSGFRAGVKEGGSFRQNYTAWIWDSTAQMIAGSSNASLAVGGTIVTTGVTYSTDGCFLDPDQKVYCRLEIVQITPTGTAIWTTRPLNEPVASGVSYQVEGIANNGLHSIGWGWPPENVMAAAPQFWYPEGLIVHSFTRTPVPEP